MAVILIADDEKNLRQMLRRILEAQGHHIIEAENGEEALVMFCAHGPDMAILDVNMGEGMNGFETCGRLREDPYGMSIPILFLTGMGKEEDMLQGFQQGADDYIRKPFNVTELLARVTAQLARLKRQSGRFAQLGEQQFRVGTIIQGNQDRYKISSRISCGGMGVIFRGYRLSDHLQVAIKTLNSTFLEDRKDIQRFLREAEATVRINHPNLASGLEVVRTQSHCFFVMKYVEGRSLAQLLDERDHLPQEEALKIVIQIATGLQHLHELGLVHRDVKPGNILVTEQGKAVLVDMGLTKPTRAEADLTTEGVILGTPYYLSPEQAMGENLDIRSDIYSLGATFYHAVTGTVPFRGSSTIAIINARFMRDPEMPSLYVPEIAGEISAIIAKMMYRSPVQRYQNPTELLRDLERVAEEEL